MSILGGILAAAGIIIALIFGIILLIKAFQVHWGWGLAYLIIPFASLVFIFKHWDISKKPFLWMILGTVLYVVGFMLLGPSLAEYAPAQ